VYLIKDRKDLNIYKGWRARRKGKFGDSGEKGKKTHGKHTPPPQK